MRARPIYGPGPEEPEPLRQAPDLAGTPVDDAEGHPAGEVYGTLADADSGLIRYLDLALRESDRHVLVPIGHITLERDHHGRRIRLRAADREELAAIPPYEPHTQRIDGPYQRSLLAAHGRVFQGERYYAHPAFDHSGLFAGEHPIVRGAGLPEPLSPLVPLSTLPEVRVAEGEPDIREWPLIDANGSRAGAIRDLIVDPEAGKVRYAVVALEPAGRQVLVPVGYLRIEEEADVVRTPALALADLRELPTHGPRPIDRDYEERIREILEERLDGDRRFQRPDFTAPRA
jgi:hypothetical protein